MFELIDMIVLVIMVAVVQLPVIAIFLASARNENRKFYRKK